MRVRFPRIAFLFAWAVSLALPLAGQSPNGTINGRVLDPSNKVIVGADLLLINDATGVKYSGKTNDDGIYIVPNLPPGPYRLQVSKRGFKTLIKPDIVLNIQDAVSINFTLPVGAAFEIVTVEGGASMINTADASVSTVVDQTYVKNMPLNGRSFQDLILLTPGIVTQGPQANGNISVLGKVGEFSVNGQRPESNNYTVDGVSANIGTGGGSGVNQGSGPSGSVSSATVLGTTQALVSVDDLREFRVRSSTYSAENGRNPGGQFAFETKSGTNQLHGTAYDYLRNGFVDAQDWFNNYFGLVQPAVRQNDFGGTLGGPVDIPHVYSGKDRTFAFLSYEGLRLAQPQPASINYVPDVALRSSAPTVLQPALKAFPVPNGSDDTANGIAQFIGTWSNPSSIDSTSIRLDHVVSTRLKFFFRYSDTISRSETRGTAAQALTPSVIKTSTYTTRTYTAGASSVFSNRMANDFRLNYSSNEVTARQVIDAFAGSSPVDLTKLTGLGPGSEPIVYIFFGSGPSQLLQGESSVAQRQWNFVDTATVSFGSHLVKLGGDYRRLTPFAILPTLLPFYYFSKSAVDTNSPSVIPLVFAPSYPLYTNFSAFAQDEWRLSQRLNLSLGLRWELNPAPSVTRGLMPYTIQGSTPDTWTLARQGTSLWRTTWYNFAPRLGAAYVLHKVQGRETILRGGGGVFFDTGQQLGSLGFQGPGFSANGQFLPGSFPTPPPIPAIVNPPLLPYSGSVYGFSPHLQLPFTLQWNASIEQALGKSQALTFSYVASHASRLLEQNQFSVPLNPNAQTFVVVQNGLTSDYNSLQTQFRRRLSGGLTALASYTWSHCLDYGSQNYNFSYQRGNCDFDVRHNLSTAFSYDLPDLGHDGFVSAVVRHWGIDNRLTLRSSFPVTLLGQPLLQSDGRTYDSGVNVVPDEPEYLYGARCVAVLQELHSLNPGQACPGGRAINPSAFSLATSGPGNAPRNFVRGFGAWQMNIAIRREFPIHENLKLQFRAEGFNIFNHPNFGSINPSLGQATFGQATATLANSPGILSPLYQTGGSRSLQFALKLIF